jgi:two-component system, NtrC family, sensor kinase
MGVEGLNETEHVSEAPSTGRVAVDRSSQAAWLDRLLDASISVRPGAGVEEAAAALLLPVAEILDDGAVGACIPGGDSGQIIIRHSSREEAPASRDPARLFPEFAHERVLTISIDDGSTLHVAADDETRLDARSPLDLVLDRLAKAIGSVVRHSRAYERARLQSAEMHGLREQVIQSEKLASLGQIAAGIVHELNNPLTSIMAYSDYLRRKAEKTGGDPSDIERLTRINEAADRILRFSRDLIAYSRPATEVPAPVAIHDIIDRALVFCEHVLDQTGVMVERNFGEVRPVRGVAGQLTQVFVNLFTNAAHAMRDQGGCLTITTVMPTDGEVSVTIVDDGHGIDADHLPRIFDPFFTTKTDGTGTGLGLSIVRNIIVSHGGRIRADGHAPRGTVFHLDLPTAAAPGSGE